MKQLQTSIKLTEIFFSTIAVSVAIKSRDEEKEINKHFLIINFFFVIAELIFGLYRARQFIFIRQKISKLRAITHVRFNKTASLQLKIKRFTRNERLRKAESRNNWAREEWKFLREIQFYEVIQSLSAKTKGRRVKCSWGYSRVSARF